MLLLLFEKGCSYYKMALFKIQGFGNVGFNHSVYLLILQFHVFAYRFQY